MEPTRVKTLDAAVDDLLIDSLSLALRRSIDRAIRQGSTPTAVLEFVRRVAATDRPIVWAVQAYLERRHGMGR